MDRLLIDKAPIHHQERLNRSGRDRALGTATGGIRIVQDRQFRERNGALGENIDAPPGRFFLGGFFPIRPR